MTIPRALHFVGIGGMGMSAIAQVWHAMGRPVTGSDSHASASVARLQGLGVSINIGHSAEQLGGAEGIVLSTAVSDQNPEVQEAIRRGIPRFHRSEILGDLMREKRSVAVTGTHGKTTTSAMVASVLVEAGADPTVLLGGDLPHMGGNARLGKGPHLIAEADESDKSIVNLSANVVVVTNLEGDHLEHYRDLAEIIEVMASFINGLPKDDVHLIACADCPGVKRLLELVSIPTVTYGFSDDADYRIASEAMTAGGSTFQLIGPDGSPLSGAYALQVPGRHNIANATAALVAAGLLGVHGTSAADGLASFTGVKRRFQTIGSVGGVTVIDDYAHHPSEIMATLQAGRLLDRPLHAVFQPHRHSRLEALLEDFGRSFAGAHSVTIMDTYAAGEAPRMVNAASLVALVATNEPGMPVSHTPTLAATVDHLADAVMAGDLVLLLGAGDIHLVAAPLLAALEGRFSPSAKTA